MSEPGSSVSVEAGLPPAADTPNRGGVRPTPAVAAWPMQVLWAGFRHARQKPLGAVAALLIVGFVVTALAAPLIAPHDPYKQSVRFRLKPPSDTFLLGTDQIGRDVLSRLIYGARISLGVGLLSTMLGSLLGVPLGLISGYRGGRFDLLVQRLTDAVLAFPVLVLALALVAVLGSSVTNVVLAIGLVQAPRVGLIVRGSVLAIKEESYVESARATGCRDGRILLRYILPNVMAPIIVITTINLGQAIIIEATLSFLGLGTPPPAPSWGEMLSGAGKQYMLAAPWLAVFPGLAISLAVLGINLLGDTLRDVWDPRLKR
jgi:peptide/nickel transport system permease protein